MNNPHMQIAYSHGKIFTGHHIERNKALLIKNNKVEAIVHENEIPSSYEVNDLGGRMIAPALIDLQIYGGNGKMFSHETTTAAIQSTHDYCAAGGCGWFMIAMATNTIDKFKEGIVQVKKYWENGGKGLLGLHLEGPYLNPVKKGAHIERYIKKPTVAEVKELLTLGKDIIKMMTVAPECCDEEIIDLLQSNGVLVSAGHTNATYEEANKGFEKIPVATHLYNAMSPLQHRAPGMVGAIFDHATAMSSVVCDGIHADFAAVRIAKQVMGRRLFYITDAVTECPDGDYPHVFRGDHYALPNGTLSGSSLTMMQCVRNGVENLGISLEESLRMASTYPGSLIRHRKIGVLEKGAEAVAVIFDDKNLKETAVTIVGA
jgi:N-acetylglucosamine-6-phosphate deacetylase